MLETEFSILGSTLTWVKNVLSNTPIYFLSPLKMLALVAKKLERIQCRYLWGDDMERRKCT